MRVSKLTLQNFKSFRNATIPFGQFNVIVGANASGKSNLVQAFQFLKDVSNHGLENAVSLQGGSDFLRNMASAEDSRVAIAIEFEPLDAESAAIRVFPGPQTVGVQTLHLRYYLRLKSRPADNGFDIDAEELNQRIRISSIVSSSDAPTQTLELIAEGEATLSRSRNESDSFNVSDKAITSGIDHSYPAGTDEILTNIIDQIYPEYVRKIGLPEDVCLIQTGLLNLLQGSSPIEDISIYDLDPQLPKRGSHITGRADLESDGSNLAIVLNDILSDAERNRRFHNLIKELLPFVDEMLVDRFADNSLLVKLRESFASNRDIPAPFLSDGTISITAIIVALAFEGNPTTVLEEPDRNIHPHLISRLASLMKDASQHSQTVITTHNPEFVRHAGIENLILVSRDGEGFSQITHPADSDTLKMFLSEEIGIHDLYVDDFLTVGV